LAWNQDNVSEWSELSSSKHFGCYDILGKTFSSFIEPPKKTKYRNEIALTTDELHVILLVGRNNIVIYDRQTMGRFDLIEVTIWAGLT
jgi:hypothetical protein